VKYRKKPIVVEAVRWKGGPYGMLEDFCGRNWARADMQEMEYKDPEQVVIWNTAEKQWLQVPVGYWIIRGIQGELYPCKPDIFDMTYAPVEP